MNSAMASPEEVRHPAFKIWMVPSAGPSTLVQAPCFKISSCVNVPWYTSLMWQILVDVWNWLSTHEWFAIWLEGVALVLIFI